MVQALAAQQWGVVARRQLLAAGLTARMVDQRVAAGRLIPVHRGVYAAGHDRLRVEGWRLAAVLAAGPGAVLSHRDAAALHAIRPSNRPAIDVTSPARGRPGPTGVTVHRSRLTPQDVTIVDGIPVTTVARTLVDLAFVVPQDHLAKALSEAERLRVLDVRALEAARARVAHRPGTGYANLSRVLADHAALGVTLTRSALEDAFLRLVEAHDLPRPAMNATLAGLEVDAYWPEHGLVVELDGWAFHRSRRAFERDRAKERALRRAGYRVERFTHRDVAHRADGTAAELQALLDVSRSSAGGSC